MRIIILYLVALKIHRLRKSYHLIYQNSDHLDHVDVQRFWEQGSIFPLIEGAVIFVNVWIEEC